ncbi:MAG: PqiC family protein [Oceanisphaera sp.]|uniref:PqiC family protein n=1 Tax=Oceanisphaera sp. TaxID=1929979 RepID=UPI003F950A6C
MITRLWYPTQLFSQSTCALLAGVALVGLSGCSSSAVTPTTYMLPSSAPTQHYQQQVAITVSPVRISGHLDTDGIVMQLNDIEVYQARQHLWAEGINQQLQQQLQQRLALNLPQSQVVSKGQPLQAELPVRDVRVQVTRFQGLTVGDALLTGQWQLLNGSGQLLNQQTFNIITPLDKDGYPALVRALGQGWEQLADDIALHIAQE